MTYWKSQFSVLFLNSWFLRSLLSFLANPNEPNLVLFFFAPELFFSHFPPSRDHWWTARDPGDWVFRGGCARWEYEGRDMLLCWSFNQVQSQITSWCFREPCSAGPNWAHWVYVKRFQTRDVVEATVVKDEATGAFVSRRL